MKTEEKIPSRSPGTASRVVDGEAVIVALKDAEINVANKVGTRIWDLVDGKRSLYDIAGVISDEFEISSEEALQDTIEFVEDLVKRKMLVLGVED